jgi:hypothetical protein
MYPLPVIAVATLILLPACAAPLPAALAHALQRREQFFVNRTVTFRLQTEKNIVAPQRQIHPEMLLSVTRHPTSIHIKSRPTQGDTVRSDAASAVINLEQMYWDTEVYLLEDAIVESEPDFYVKQGEQSPTVLGTIAYVNRPLVNEYGVPSGNEACLATTGIAGVFTIGLSVARIPEARWEKVEDRPDRWILRGKTKDYRLMALNRHIDWRQHPAPEVSLYIELRKPDALPLLAVVESAAGRDKGRSTFRTNAYKQVDTLTVPARIEFEHESMVGTQKVTYTLLRVERASGQNQLKLPIGTLMVDERIGISVNYRWQGRLPTEEELKQMANQQGNLLPSGTPRRRYTLWLFIPALVFFALAAYFYFKGKRR